MAKHITVRAAQPNTRDQEIEPVYLTITGYFPYSTKDGELERTRDGFKEDAAKIFEALRSLPGGTFDQLLILMLQKTASNFIVATDPPLSNAEHYQRKAAGVLYEACENCLLVWDSDSPSVDPDEVKAMLQNALAKARGESEAQDES